MSKVQFTIEAQYQKARVGTIHLNGVTVRTPVFMPVGTKATIKWLPLEWLQKAYLGTDDDIRLILANTFHLYLHPGAERIAQHGGLHQFQQRNGLILTDSGWFQVFSLGLSKTGKSLVNIHPHGVTFTSPYDGSKHLFTPQSVVDTQRAFRSDIMMMLDVCSPVHNISKKEVAEHMHITHRWAKEAYQHHMEQYEQHSWVLLPIIQWGLYTDLREESAHLLQQYATDGIAIGGLSVGETKEEMQHILENLTSHLPDDKPRYVMWIGTPEDIRTAIYAGIDMFDCVMPTRLGRHGTAFTAQGNLHLKKAACKDDLGPVEPTCRCMTCTKYTRSYLHHLIKEKEMLWWMLLSLHNIAYLQQIVENIHQEIREKGIQQ